MGIKWRIETESNCTQNKHHSVFYVFPQLVDILKGYIDMGVMMQKPNAGGERELRRHYKVCMNVHVD